MPTTPPASPSSRHLRRAALAALGVFGILACVGDPAKRSLPSVAAPLVGVNDAFESAARVTLPVQPPMEEGGLHNTFRLSENIISGAEPHSEETFESLASMGVKTLLSVDGKVPDSATAARHGMRYVHIPIRYKGIPHEELLRIAKTFRELEGPFYVHCFHGRHRGPAAAAVGRLVLDGASREDALAEMRQWSRTSSKYSGLYGTIALAEMPEPGASAALQWDFPSRHQVEGLRGAMVGISRVYEALQESSDVDWKFNPEHPDLNAEHEASQLLDFMESMTGLDEVVSGPSDQRGWADDSVRATRSLVEALAQFKEGQAGATERADDALDHLAKSCSACHKAYRND